MNGTLTTVFVYGTLIDPERAAAVLDDWRYVGDAVLHGLHRVEGGYPTLVPGGSVRGRLLRTTDIGWLDDYEGVGRGLYVRVGVPLVGDAVEPPPEPGTVTVYVGNPERLAAPVDWPGEGPFDDRVRRHVDAHDVVIRTGE